MKTFNYTITDPVGLHARPAGLVVTEIKKYNSTVTIKKGEKSSDGSKLMKLMALGIKCGDEVTVEVAGPDEDVAAAAIEGFFNTYL